MLTFFGVFLITSGRQRRDEDEEYLDDAEGIDETIGLMDQDGNPTEVPDDDFEDAIVSRRSSKVSRVSFAKPPRNVYEGEQEGTPTIRPHIVVGTPPGVRSLETIDGQVLETPPRGARTISSDSLASAPPPSISDVPPVAPPAVRDQAAGQGSERPVTPRANTTTPKSTSRDRDRTFYSPSPLYSTVTTVVKDALRDKAALNDQSSLRRIRSSIRASLFLDSDDDESTGNEIDTQQTIAVPPSQNDLMRILTGPEQEHEPVNEPNRQRARSLSATVGNFFRSKKKAKNDDIESGLAGDQDGEPSA